MGTNFKSSKIACLIVCLLLHGCAVSFLPDGTVQKSIDYGRLFDVAYKLSSGDKAENIIGLNKLIGEANTNNFVRWFNATTTAIKAAKYISDGVKPRSIKIREVITEYERRTLP